MVRWLLLGFVLSVFSGANAYAQEICRYCTEIRNLRVANDMSNQFRLDLANKSTKEVDIFIGDNVKTSEALTYDLMESNILSNNKVCKGVVTYIEKCYFTHKASKERFQIKNKISIFPCGVCDGTLQSVDDYRNEPFKVMLNEERKRFAEEVNKVASRISEDAVKGQIKTLVETELSSLQTRWIDKTARAAADLLQK